MEAQKQQQTFPQQTIQPVTAGQVAYLIQPGYPVGDPPAYTAAADHSGAQPTEPSQVALSVPIGTVPPKPKTHIGFAMFSILWCLPFGIVALVYANLVNRSYKKGKYEQATNYSDWAQIWGSAALCFGIIIYVIAGVVQIVLMASV